MAWSLGLYSISSPHARPSHPHFMIIIFALTWENLLSNQRNTSRDIIFKMRPRGNEKIFVILSTQRSSFIFTMSRQSDALMIFDGDIRQNNREFGVLMNENSANFTNFQRCWAVECFTKNDTLECNGELGPTL
jgi:hypothetical protein